MSALVAYPTLVVPLSIFVNRLSILPNKIDNLSPEAMSVSVAASVKVTVTSEPSPVLSSLLRNAGVLSVTKSVILTSTWPPVTTVSGPAVLSKSTGSVAYTSGAASW